MTKAIQKTENRGGARDGSGRKPLALAEDFKDKLREALDEKAHATGETFYKMLVDLAFDKRQSITARTQLIKIIASTFTVKQSHQTIDKTELHAVVMLPPVMQPPSRLVEGTGVVIDGDTGEVVGE